MVFGTILLKADRHCKCEPAFNIVVSRKLPPTGRMWRHQHRCITLVKTVKNSPDEYAHISHAVTLQQAMAGTFLAFAFVNWAKVTP